jgi:hypothetical protein
VRQLALPPCVDHVSKLMASVLLNLFALVAIKNFVERRPRSKAVIGNDALVDVGLHG